LEILVSDNFSQDNTEEIVKQFSDNRIRYINTGKRVSMSHNWEFALSHISEGWVTILGDDDAILQGAVQKVLHIAKKTGVKAIRSSTCQYSWPSIREKQCGQLNISSGCGYEVRNSNYWISKVVNGQNNYKELPMLYNGGFVNISVLQAIKRITGALYLSRIPDIYSGFAIAHMINKYVYCHEPLAVNGASIHSSGTAHFTLKGESHEKPMKLFVSEANISYHPEIFVPKSEIMPKCLQIYVYESYLQSLPLATHRDSNANPQRQIKLILMEAAKSRENISCWVKKFCDLHNLVIPRSVESTSRLAPHLLLDICRSKFGQLTVCSTTGSICSPLSNVYEASKEACRIIRKPPSIAQNIIRNSFKLVKSVISR
jgi:glycosyltransferase involved in cell wall biosynthesis